jgi:hypothetical protein
MRRYLLALLVLPLTGCAGLTIPADPARMTAEQLREWRKDSNANVTCVRANTPYGNVVTVFVVLDKGVVPAGTVTVDEGCKTTVTTKP